MRLFLSLVLLATYWLANRVSADEIRLSARQLLEMGVATDLRLSSDASAIELERGILIEDDGPAAGFSYRPNEEQLGPGVHLRKVLLIDNPRASAATLLIGGKGEYQLALNGQPCPWEPAGRSGNYWFNFRLPPDRLKKGANEFVFTGEGSLWIARDDEFAAGSLARREHPNRSAKSSDSGSTWDDRNLGPRGDIDGEYYVRLHLDQYRSRGRLTLPVMDVGNLSRAPIAPALAPAPRLKIAVLSDGSDAGSVTLVTRSGPTPNPKDSGWSDWKQVASDHWLDPLPGRYFQAQCDLSTADPLHSPRLRELRIEGQSSQRSDWLDKVRVKDFQNSPIAQLSLPFEYEPLDQPQLQQLRREFKLDDVVAGAKDELELIARLAKWTSGLWQHPGHIGKVYPSWNALEILQPHADGQPVGGFCQQYAVVFLQACESFGLAGRCVSLSPGSFASLGKSGHETTEIWSNQYRKWIYVDGNMAWYAMDEKSGVPLSLLELHDRQLNALEHKPFQPIRIVSLAETKPAWTGLASWPPFVELRMIPRSNFLAQAAPLPLNQGMRGWFWPDHYAWTDDRAPAALLYHRHVHKRSDWEWTINQAQLWLEAQATPGAVRVFVRNSAPSLDAVLAKTGDRPLRPITGSFEWELQSGVNRLEVWPQNKAGREGIVSRVVLLYSDQP